MVWAWIVVSTAYKIKLLTVRSFEIDIALNTNIVVKINPFRFIVLCEGKYCSNHMIVHLFVEVIFCLHGQLKIQTYLHVFHYWIVIIYGWQVGQFDKSYSNQIFVWNMTLYRQLCGCKLTWLNQCYITWKCAEAYHVQMWVRPIC